MASPATCEPSGPLDRLHHIQPPHPAVPSLILTTDSSSPSGRPREQERSLLPSPSPSVSDGIPECDDAFKCPPSFNPADEACRSATDTESASSSVSSSPSSVDEDALAHVPAARKLHAEDAAHTGRRQSSIQFMSIEDGPAELKTQKFEKPRRNRSPPPPPLFQQRVSFNTLEKETNNTSLSLVYTHRHFGYSRTSRRFLCGLGDNDYSEFALQWLFDEMVDDNDEIVCLRVIDKAVSSAASESFFRDEAQRIMTKVLQQNTDSKAVQVTLELAVGRVQDVFSQMIQLHEPMILVVGTKGKSRAGIQGLLPGSISKYALQCSPVPVVVVNPSLVRDKRKKKRMQERQKQGRYQDLLDRSHDHPSTFSLQPATGDTTPRSHSTINLSTTGIQQPQAKSRWGSGFLSRPTSAVFSPSLRGGQGIGSGTRSGANSNAQSSPTSPSHPRTTAAKDGTSQDGSSSSGSPRAPTESIPIPARRKTKQWGFS